MTRGFTLVEVVIALVVLEVGLVGALGLLALASRSVTRAERLESAATVVEGIADSLASVGRRADGARTLPEGGRVVWRVDESGAFSVRYDAGEAGGPRFTVTGRLPEARAGAR